jgi:phosphatidylglycerol:prolipoprotein diacylglycerol transferase
LNFPPLSRYCGHLAKKLKAKAGPQAEPFERLGSFTDMHPVLFKPFGFAIYSYSFVLILSFIFPMMLAVYLAKKRGPVDSDYIQELAMWGIIWGLIGSRMGWVLQNPELYITAPWKIFNLREGGMTILGGIIVPSIVLFITGYRRGFDARNLLDVFAAPLLLGMALGRVGCVLHGCCYGDSCDPGFPLAITYPQGPGMPVGPRYPAQFFEAAADLVLMGFVLWFLPRIRFAGQAIWATIGGYGMIRFLNEFIRADGRELAAGGVTIAQLVALGLFFFFGVFAMWGGLGKPAVDVSWQTGPANTQSTSGDKKAKSNKKKP